jgi:hypothetical protein
MMRAMSPPPISVHPMIPDPGDGVEEDDEVDEDVPAWTMIGAA